MRLQWLRLVNVGVFFCVVCSASGQAVTAFENGIPFSFVCDGKPAKQLLASWQRSETVQPLSQDRMLRTITYRDPTTHLEITREITTFPEKNAIEWVLRLRNTGSNDSAMLENILPLDVDIPVPAGGAVTFHHAHGSRQGEADYTPVDKDLSPGTTVQIAHYVLQNGIHKDGYIPFFNLQWAGGGLVGAIGWSGQWTVSAARSAESVALKSGQELTHLRLHPGESIRTPSILLIQWSGADRTLGQNALRQLLLSYYAARVDGKVAMPPVTHTGAYALIFDGIAQKTGQNPLDILPTLRDQDLGAKGGHGFPGPNDALNFVTEKRSVSRRHMTWAPGA